MIGSIELTNIRNFEGEGWIFPLRMLTVFCGTNSAGKTTVFKSLLLFTQSQFAREEGESASNSGKLSFMGRNADLGGYSSFVSHREIERDIGLSFTVNGWIPKRSFEKIWKLVHPDGVPPESTESSGAFLYELRADFSFGLVAAEPSSSSPTAEESGQLTLEDLHVEPVESGSASHVRSALLKSTEYHLSVSGEEVLAWEIGLERYSFFRGEPRAEYVVFIPDGYFQKTGLGRMEAQYLPDQKRYKLKVDMQSGLLPSLVRGKFRAKKVKGSDERSEPTVLPLPPEIFNPVYSLRRSLSGIHYIGPLRCPAKRYYISNVDTAPAMDSTGEFLPYTLRQNAEQLIRCGLPGEPQGRNLHPLRTLVNRWLYYLRTGERPEPTAADREVEISTQANVLLEFTLRGPGGLESHALADSGFGYSQVLPIIVRGLIARPGQTLLIEQPELHLNPALQVRLAEFFVALSGAGRQLILETHSEHLVNALRVFAAEDQTGELASDVRIFFIDSEAGLPQIHILDVQENGTVPDWPAHFFGEAMNLSARLLKAQARSPRHGVTK